MSKSKKYTLLILIPILLQLVLAAVSRIAVSPTKETYSVSIDILFAAAGMFFAVYLLVSKDSSRYGKYAFPVGSVIFVALSALALILADKIPSQRSLIDYIIALHPALCFALVCLCSGKGMKGVAAVMVYTLLICLGISQISYGALFCVLTVIMCIMLISVKNGVFGEENKSVYYVMIILPIVYTLCARLYTGDMPEIIFVGGATQGSSALDIIRDVRDNIAFIGPGGAISPQAKALLAGYPLLFWAYSLGWAALLPIFALIAAPCYAFYQLIKSVKTYEGRMFSLTVGLTFLVRIISEIPITFGLFYVKNDMAFPFLESGEGSVIYALLLAVWFALISSSKTPEPPSAPKKSNRKAKKTPEERDADFLIKDALTRLKEEAPPAERKNEPSRKEEKPSGYFDISPKEVKKDSEIESLFADMPEVAKKKTLSNPQEGTKQTSPPEAAPRERQAIQSESAPSAPVMPPREAQTLTDNKEGSAADKGDNFPGFAEGRTASIGATSEIGTTPNIEATPKNGAIPESNTAPQSKATQASDLTPQTSQSKADPESAATPKVGTSPQEVSTSHDNATPKNGATPKINITPQSKATSESDLNSAATNNNDKLKTTPAAKPAPFEAQAEDLFIEIPKTRPLRKTAEEQAKQGAAKTASFGETKTERKNGESQTFPAAATPAEGDTFTDNKEGSAEKKADNAAFSPIAFEESFAEGRTPSIGTTSEIEATPKIGATPNIEAIPKNGATPQSNTAPQSKATQASDLIPQASQSKADPESEATPKVGTSPQADSTSHDNANPEKSSAATEAEIPPKFMANIEAADPAFKQKEEEASAEKPAPFEAETDNREKNPSKGAAADHTEGESARSGYSPVTSDKTEDKPRAEETVGSDDSNEEILIEMGAGGFADALRVIPSDPGEEEEIEMSLPAPNTPSGSKEAESIKPPKAKASRVMKVDTEDDVFEDDDGFIDMKEL
ncbi:MAG: hypothetical protein GX061_08235 [Eubacteriaceae bacterium]|nr:hypothetical protein [Eubacteriaceae bacterium]